MKSTVTIGVLALQGSFQEHVDALNHVSTLDEINSQGLTIGTRKVTLAQDLHEIDALIIPGGESTAMQFLSSKQNEPLFEKLGNWIKNSGKAVWGTCAGLILLTDQQVIKRDSKSKNIGGLAIEVERNYFGRQKSSFVSNCRIDLSDEHISDTDEFEGVFIRAPGITRINSSKVKTIAWINRQNEEAMPVGIRQENLLGTSFHPELVKDYRFHRYFINMALRYSQ